MKCLFRKVLKPLSQGVQIQKTQGLYCINIRNMGDLQPPSTKSQGPNCKFAPATHSFSPETTTQNPPSSKLSRTEIYTTGNPCSCPASAATAAGGRKSLIEARWQRALSVAGEFDYELLQTQKNHQPIPHHLFNQFAPSKDTHFQPSKKPQISITKLQEQ